MTTGGDQLASGFEALKSVWGETWEHRPADSAVWTSATVVVSDLGDRGRDMLRRVRAVVSDLAAAPQEGDAWRDPDLRIWRVLEVTRQVGGTIATDVAARRPDSGA